MKSKVMLISFPFASATVNQFILEMVEILDPICEKLFLMIGTLPANTSLSDKVTVLEIGTTLHPSGTIKPIFWSHLLQSLKIGFIQLKMCLLFFVRRSEIDVAFFYMGGYAVLLPVLAAKLCKKRVLTTALGCGSLSAKKAEKKTIGAAMAFFEHATYAFSDIIVAESPAVIDSCSLSKYKNKITTKGARFIDSEIFQLNRPLKDRMNVIGFLGRLTKDKGVLDFVQAVPLILRKRDDVTFSIGGDGILFPNIVEILARNHTTANVKMEGWIPSAGVPSFLNNLKILVVPSYQEGLPTVILQAMACGTPVVATAVGGVPDIIIDGKTGFIIDYNSAESIADAILRALTSPELDTIAKIARRLIEERYSLNGAIERYKEILAMG
jgi:glycosyltransferase involved in cell wall biosynthesis